MIPIGVVCLVYGLKPVEVAARYDDACVPAGVGASNAERQAWLWAVRVCCLGREGGVRPGARP